MKIVTFNINGVNARLVNLITWLEEAAPDVMCLQETKCTDSAFPAAPWRRPASTACSAGCPSGLPYPARPKARGSA